MKHDSHPKHSYNKGQDSPRYNELNAKFEDTSLPQGKHAYDESKGDGNLTVSKISERLSNEKMEKQHDDTVADFDRIFEKFGLKPEDENRARDNEAMQMSDDGISLSNEETDDQAVEDRSPDLYRIAGTIAPEVVASHAEVEASLHSDKETGEEGPKGVFFTALYRELADMIQSGAISHEQAAIKRREAKKIDFDNVQDLSEDPAEDAIAFARAGLENVTLETDKPSVEEVRELIDSELEPAVAPLREDIAAAGETPAPIKLDIGDLDTGPINTHKVRELAIQAGKAAKKQTVSRLAGKQHILRKFTRKEWKEMKKNEKNFIPEPSIFGRLLGNWSREQRRVKRNKKLGAKAANEQVEEPSYAEPHY